MSKLVLLDCCTLGLITNPSANQEAERCRQWATDLRRKGVVIKVPEIADYELRREYIRFNMGTSLAELDQLIRTVGYAPLTTDSFRKAAELWAIARRDYDRNAHCSHKLDADMILCGQAHVESLDAKEVVIATDNLRHIRLGWRESYLWEDITP